MLKYAPCVGPYLHKYLEMKRLTESCYLNQAPLPQACFLKGPATFQHLKKTLKSKPVEQYRVVIKSRGPGIFPGYYESRPQLLLLENRRKIEQQEKPRHLIPRLPVVFTRQLEILVTTLTVAQFLAYKPGNFAPLTNSFIVSLSK